ncbi:D-3-phosphoglycerate dehydrogenase [Corynebacterium xerosis]|nr:D-3-phosphoglycerate dehydrogenase [Corynebacterium xerosis]
MPPEQETLGEGPGASKVEPEELYSRADVVSLHAPCARSSPPGG